ncbi:MAG: hypothetical protein WCA27_14895 [Candidatus Sulfotelmatobacter sp.]
MTNRKQSCKSFVCNKTDLNFPLIMMPEIGNLLLFDAALCQLGCSVPVLRGREMNKGIAGVRGTGNAEDFNGYEWSSGGKQGTYHCKAW